MATLIHDDLSDFALRLQRITEECNTYISNQMPDQAEIVEDLSRKLVDDFLVSTDEHIKEVVMALSEVLSKERSDDANAEASKVDDIREVTDIIAPKNLVMTHTQLRKE